MFPPVNADKMNLDYCMRLLPHHADTGGFFVAVLEKTAKLPWQAEEKKCPAPAKDLQRELYHLFTGLGWHWILHDITNRYVKGYRGPVIMYRDGPSMYNGRFRKK